MAMHGGYIDGGGGAQDRLPTASEVAADDEGECPAE
jgi:hypothetical protein